jgi:chromosome segregation ATPase
MKICINSAILSKKSLLAKLDAIQEAHQEELIEARRRESSARESLETATARHASELARADERVRRALSERDADIERLEARLRSAEARAAEAEAVIRELHEGL